MIYFGLILIMIGIWQLYMRGSYSSVVSSVSFIVGLIIILIAKWEIGLFLLVILFLLFLFGKFVGKDKKKIRRIIKAFLKAKKDSPNINDDKLCREILIKRLVSTKLTSGIHNEDMARLFISDVYKDRKFTIDALCETIIVKENRDAGSTNDIERLSKLIKEIKSKLIKTNN